MQNNSEDYKFDENFPTNRIFDIGQQIRARCVGEIGMHIIHFIICQD